jgi:hypothetical protein
MVHCHADEFNALLHNKTWSFVSPTVAKNVVSYKWVFKLKHKVDGTIERHKARLVAKGYCKDQKNK